MLIQLNTQVNGIFWQHTDVGSVKGNQKEVDLNVFNGTLEDLEAITIK